MSSVWESFEQAVGRPLPAWAKRSLAGVAAGCATAAGLAAFHGSVAVVAGGGGAVGLATLGLAVLLGRLPHPRRGQIGFLIALDAEGAEYATRLRNDFIRVLRDRAAAVPVGGGIAVIEYPPERCAGVTDRETGARALQESGCHLVLFGPARVRELGGTQHVFSPRLLIGHPPIPEETSAAIGNEMSRLVPQQLMVSKEGDFLGFVVASEWMLLAAEYTIGIVALACGDLDTGEHILSEVRKGLDGSLKDVPQLRNVARELPKRLASIHAARAGRAYREWERSRQKDPMLRQEQHAERAIALDPRCEPALLGLAISAFVLRRDVTAAWGYIRRCANGTATWRYSEAFLYLYEGRLDRARAAYRTAAGSPTREPSDYLQSEIFMQEVLDQEPDKVQMHFGMGAINLFVKGDIDAAEAEFKRFAEADTAQRFRVHHVWAETAIAGARRKLGP